MFQKFNADCGFDPKVMECFDVFDDIDKLIKTNDSGTKIVDLCCMINIAYYSPGPSLTNAKIEEFANMKNGTIYRLIYHNSTAAGDFELPSGTKISGEDTMVNNGDTVMYEIFTDGRTLYANRVIFPNA